ncbi:3'(2'),5'-bisphosphate nucleotidase CysQ [Gallaecimonas sp. GXIMD4217]|uniref:3'(2'),5'-bisphosphate nucleotidase CysQ n=1 Tax=Gallaecimonas sp. GXIMD4217 TaxID=3131927 RepID=UPI00311B3B27
MRPELEALVIEAGKATLAHYRQQLEVAHKADGSPLSAADRASHDVLVAGLSALSPALPILSEEGRHHGWQERRRWRRFWLLDPLDGTKEFLAGRDDFTVNLALIEDGVPVLGLVYAPVHDRLYVGEQGQGAWRVDKGVRRAIHCRKVEPPVVVGSRSHPAPELADWLAELGEHEMVSVGSSLKFCLVAEGKAQYYPRFNPTMMWDTAAGQAVAEAAGARVSCLDGSPLRYHREALRNPGFMVSCS